MTEQIDAAKRARRADLRTLRAGLDPSGERAIRLWSHVRDEPAIRSARVVMAFESVAGEPDTAAFLAWCRSVGKMVVVPAADRDAPFPVAADVPDAVVVPGLAFTASGDRLGRGGGWYDRFLVGRRNDCVAIGVCFAEQVVDELPIEEHDRAVDLVVTDLGRATVGEKFGDR